MVVIAAGIFVKEAFF